jgi:hypothetical protein
MSDQHLLLQETDSAETLLFLETGNFGTLEWPKINLLYSN